MVTRIAGMNVMARTRHHFIFANVHVTALASTRHFRTSLASPPGGQGLVGSNPASPTTGSQVIRSVTEVCELVTQRGHFLVNRSECKQSLTIGLVRRLLRGPPALEGTIALDERVVPFVFPRSADHLPREYARQPDAPD